MPAAMMGSARGGLLPLLPRSQWAARGGLLGRLVPPRRGRDVSGGEHDQWQRGAGGREANGSAAGGCLVRLREFRPRARSSPGCCGVRRPRSVSAPVSATR